MEGVGRNYKEMGTLEGQFQSFLRPFEKDVRNETYALIVMGDS